MGTWDHSESGDVGTAGAPALCRGSNLDSVCGGKRWRSCRGRLLESSSQPRAGSKGIGTGRSCRRHAQREGSARNAKGQAKESCQAGEEEGRAWGEEKGGRIAAEEE